jgi:FkbM family methyltransferase
MRPESRITHRVGHALRMFGDGIARRGTIEGTWIDVGAIENPGLKVYALEPNLAAAAKLMGRAANYFVVPTAVAESDGFADFHLNAFEAASSLLPLNEVSLRSWIGGERLRVDSVVTVPTIRLDTFIGRVGIDKVDFLKIDTQGMDLAVVRSAGSRLRDIARISLEVDVKPVPLYCGAPSKDEVVDFLKKSGFSLVAVEKQTEGQEENLTFIRADRFHRLRDVQPEGAE